MHSRDTPIEDIFAVAKLWPAEIAAVRAILMTTDLTEEVKWGSPCYTWNDHNIAILWEMKSGCVLDFFKGVLLADPHGLLELPGKNSRSTMMLRFTDLDDIAAQRGWMIADVFAAVRNQCCKCMGAIAPKMAPANNSGGFLRNFGSRSAVRLRQWPLA